MEQMKLWAGLCEICNTWNHVEDMPLLWQLSEGVFRGVCSICNEDLEKKAKELDWSGDDYSK